MSDSITGAAPAKVNLALVVGPLRDDGKHEIVSVMAPLGLADRIELEPAEALDVTGFDEDTLVRGALEALATAADTETRWRVAIEKEIPVAAGLGGGSSDARRRAAARERDARRAAARCALARARGHARRRHPVLPPPGPKLARGDGTVLEPLELVADFTVVLVLPHGAEKSSTAAVYREFDARRGDRGFEARVAALEHALRGDDLAGLPPNDLASSPHAARLEELGAFRADVTGAGPAVYGLFRDGDAAAEAARAVEPLGRVWVDKPGW